MLTVERVDEIRREVGRRLARYVHASGSTSREAKCLALAFLQPDEAFRRLLEARGIRGLDTKEPLERLLELPPEPGDRCPRCHRRNNHYRCRLCNPQAA